MGNLIGLYPDELEKLLNEDITIIDIRRESEFLTTGIIKKSITLTFFDDFGNYDIENWMKEFQNHIKDKEQKFVLVCAHANRTTAVGTYLIEQGYKNVAHLYGGISLWIEEQKETLAY